MLQCLPDPAQKVHQVGVVAKSMTLPLKHMSCDDAPMSAHPGLAACRVALIKLITLPVESIVLRAMGDQEFDLLAFFECQCRGIVL